MRWSCCAAKDRDRDVRIQGTHFGLVQKGWSSQTVRHIHLCFCTCNISNITFDEWLEQLRIVYEVIRTILMRARLQQSKSKDVVPAFLLPLRTWPNTIPQRKPVLLRQLHTRRNSPDESPVLAVCSTAFRDSLLPMPINTLQFWDCAGTQWYHATWHPASASEPHPLPQVHLPTVYDFQDLTGIPD